MVGLLFCKEHWDGGQAGDGAAELRGEAECTRMTAGGAQGAAESRGGQDWAKGPRLKTGGGILREPWRSWVAHPLVSSLPAFSTHDASPTRL